LTNYKFFNFIKRYHLAGSFLPSPFFHNFPSFCCCFSRCLPLCCCCCCWGNKRQNMRCIRASHTHTSIARWRKMRRVFQGGFAGWGSFEGRAVAFVCLASFIHLLQLHSFSPPFCVLHICCPSCCCCTFPRVGVLVHWCRCHLLVK